MRMLALMAGLAAATPALAQPADPHAHHRAPTQATQPAGPHAGHAVPAEPAQPDPHAHHRPPQPDDPHAAHAAPPEPAQPDPHAAHRAAEGAPTADPHAGHTAPAAAVGNAPAPPAPSDHAADGVFPRAAMERARHILRHEHGDVRWWHVMVERAEYAPSSETLSWEARASYGGDINRLVLKTEGEAESGDLHEAEVQALYSRAIGPYFNLQAGVRQDFQPRPRRTYAVLGIEGLAPYWFEVGGFVFVSDKGDVSARLEGGIDWRLTQALVLEPHAEANLAAQDTRELGVGSGLSELEVGLRLRYAVAPEFAPYVGVEWARKFGDTADYARAAGEDPDETRLVIGLRAWF